MTYTTLDTDNITLLFKKHRDTIVSFLINRVQCPETAQDLSQETYLRLLRIESVPHSENLTGYLFRTAENLAIDFIRRHQRITSKTTVLDEKLPCNQKQPEDLIILRQQCELLLDTINSLPQQCRQIFLLRKIDELSYSQIATQLSISEKTVQRQLVKAMLHCHHRLHPDYF